MHWLLGLSMALNQLANALFGGDPDMSLSARAGYARAHGAKLGGAVCQLLDWVDPHDGDSPRGDHCEIAIYHHEFSRSH